MNAQERIQNYLVLLREISKKNDGARVERCTYNGSEGYELKKDNSAIVKVTHLNGGVNKGSYDIFSYGLPCAGVFSFNVKPVYKALSLLYNESNVSGFDLEAELKNIEDKPVNIGNEYVKCGDETIRHKLKRLAEGGWCYIWDCDTLDD